MQPLLHVDNLKISIQSTPIVHGISFKIHESETVAIVGESGSGKSMSALSLLNLFSPNLEIKISGSAFYNNQNLLLLKEPEMQQIRGKHIALIFQQALSALNPLMKIGKQINEAILLHRPQIKAQSKKEVLELLDYVGIEDPHLRYNAYPHMLSGGMRQRVMIAMALACKPKLLIADEPTTALDVTIQTQIMQLLHKIKREQNMSILLITHDLGLVAGFSDRVYIMKEGSLVEHGKTDKIFYSPQHPYTQMLLSKKLKWQTNV